MSKAMEFSDSTNAIVIPSRTIVLTGVPPELNNNESLHTYFKKFGSLLWINEKYEQETDAVITFFSISDAISAYMSNETVLDIDSIQKSWFEYTKTCELCPYKYSSQASIKQHMAQCHDSKISADTLKAGKENVNGTIKVMGNQVERKEFDVGKFNTAHGVGDDKQAEDNEMKKDSGSTNSLNEARKRRYAEQTEIGSLKQKVASMQFEEENILESLEEKSKQLEEMELRLTQITKNNEILKKEKLRMNHEFLTLKRKYEDLNDLFNRTVKQRDLARSEADMFNSELESLKADKKCVEDVLKEKCKQLESEELGLRRFVAGHELLLRDKDRLENELNAKRAISNEKERMECEISALNLKIADLNEALSQAKSERNLHEVNPTESSSNLRALLTENMELVNEFKECKRLDEMDKDFKRISTKYGLLMKGKENKQHAGKNELTKGSIRIENEISTLKRKIESLSIALMNMEKERDLAQSKIHALDEQLKLMLTDKMKMDKKLNDKCKQLEDKELEVIHITTKYEWLLKETERMDNELLCLKRKNEDLSESFHDAMDERDMELPEVITLKEKLHALQNENQSISAVLKQKCQQLDEKHSELNQISLNYERLLKENERLDIELTGKRQLEEKEAKDNVKSSLEQKNKMLTDALYSVENEKRALQSELTTLKEKLHTLQTEKEQVVETFDEKRKLEVKQMKKLSAKYDILGKDKNRGDIELKDLLNEKERMSSEMLALTRKNDDLRRTLNANSAQRENERYEIDTLNGKLQALQTEMDKVMANLEGNCRQLERKELDIKRLSMRLKLMLTEKERTDNKLKAEREQMIETTAENVRLKTEVEQIRSEKEVKNQQMQDKECLMKSILIKNELMQKEIDKLKKDSIEKNRVLKDKENHLLNLTKENQKLLKDSLVKDKLLKSIQSSFSVLMPKNANQSEYGLAKDL